MRYEEFTIEGRNAVLEAIRAGKTIDKIFVLDGCHDGPVNTIVREAKKGDTIISYVQKERLDNMSKTGHHQGVIAYAAAYDYAQVEDILENARSKGEDPFVFILDNIEDPHNFGAIIRTCVCAGVDGIIIPSRRNVQVNSVVEKTSAGAINHIPIIKVNSLVNAVQTLKDSNWWIIATDASAKDNYYDVRYDDMNFAVIMGAEHAGVSKSLLKASDFVVKIPMQNSFNSLNVSNALSAIIFETLRQKLVNKRK